MPNLQSLILDSNALDFTFSGIEQATSLTTLDLTHLNNLDSVLGIGNSPSLVNLYLTSNNLQGTFPSELLNITTLQRLSLAFNSLTGNIPRSIGSDLSILKFLSLHDNGFVGSIPSSLGNNDNLRYLLLQSNELNGTIPETFANGLGQIWFLNLSKQKKKDKTNTTGLTGTLPPFESMTQLKRMDLSDNSLNGPLPTNFLSNSNLTAFEFLDLSSNMLSGLVPSTLRRFPLETSVNLVDNLFTAFDDGLCQTGDNNVEMPGFGCDAILCSSGTYNDEGKQQASNTPCKDCPSAIYLGSTYCPDDVEPTPSPIDAGTQHLPTNMTEREILSLFYDECGGPRWTRNDKWKKQDESICNWFGISCLSDDTESIKSIMLSSNELIGIPPPQLFQLPNLETLVLDTNRILFKFDQIQHAKRLITLDLSATGLFDVSGIEQSSSLKELHLSSNELRGEIPRGLFLRTLEQLSLDFNAYTGSIPNEISNSKNLKLLSIASNAISSTIPTSLGELTELVTLRLHKNVMYGTLPTEMERMTSLTFVDLSRQTTLGGPGFSGELQSFATLSNLRRFDLSSNSISGVIPPDFLIGVNEHYFEYVDLSQNKIEGSIPSGLSRLSTIFLTDNKIGSMSEYCNKVKKHQQQQDQEHSHSSLFQFVPLYQCDAILCPPGTYSSLGRQESEATKCTNCPSAMYFGTTNCKISDQSLNPVPIDIGIGATNKINEKEILTKFYNECHGQHWSSANNWLSDDVSICNWEGVRCAERMGETIKEISLGSKNIRGTPPPELFRLPNLESLKLYSNPLNGINFTDIRFAVTLKELLLDATGLESVQGVSDAPNLLRLNIRFNKISGRFPKELISIKTLKSLTISHNNLGGLIPSNLDQMTNLESLLISNNDFEGNLQNISLPPSVSILDLSKNHLSGTIPPNFLDTIPNTAELKVDLSNNSIRGNVPKTLARFENLELYLADNEIISVDPEICTKEN